VPENQNSIQEKISSRWSQRMRSFIWCRIFCHPVC